MSREFTLLARRPTHPGEMLREEFMPEFELTVARLAEAIGMSRQSVNELVHERRSLSPDMALRLARLFGMSPQFWLNLQRNIDIWDAFEANHDAIEAIEALPALAVG